MVTFSRNTLASERRQIGRWFCLGSLEIEFVIQRVEQCGVIVPVRSGIVPEGFSHSTNIEGKSATSGDTATLRRLTWHGAQVGPQQSSNQIVKRPSNVDVGNVDMPVRMRFFRLFESVSLRR